jgi:serine/threonine-protein kinase
MRDPSGKALELVHRDVSPLNIFVTYYGMVKLLDFGIVKGVTDPSRTVPGVFKGKYAYCAPEQLDGGLVTRQTDIFCLGIVLWECLTGRRLFLRDTDAQTIDAVRGHEIEPPSALRKGIPRELDQIVLQALSRQRVVRFGTAHAFSEALDRFLAKREERPTSKSIGLWLESVFGAQRATLKKAIAQGSEVEAALNLLPKLDGERVATGESPGSAPGSRSAAMPRMPWSSRLTNAGAPEPKVLPFGSTASPVSVIQSGLAAANRGAAPGTFTPMNLSAPPATALVRPAKPNGVKQGVIAALLAATVVVTAGVALTRSRAKTEAPAPLAAVSTVASLTLASDPPGAQIFIDGDPSGLTTPSTLTGLHPGRPLEIRLDKDGFQPATEKVELKPGETRSRAFRLVADVGTVTVEGLPAQAMIYLDDKLVEGRGPLTLALGDHRVRIETSAGVIWSETVNVAPGQQTIHVGSQRRGAKAR